MFSESDLLPLSGLQHFVFCERQAALIHVEQLWADDVRTIEGTRMHEVADEAGPEMRADVWIARGLPLRSLRLGLSGKADVVEFHRAREDENGLALSGLAGRWRPFPVEYKRGKPKRNDCDSVQLCAQALCLEEVFGVSIEEGALFYGRTRRRLAVNLDERLRRRTEEVAAAFRRLVESRTTPRAEWAPKCRGCSLFDLCRPRANEKSARRFVSATLAHVSRGENGEGGA